MSIQVLRKPAKLAGDGFLLLVWFGLAAQAVRIAAYYVQ